MIARAGRASGLDLLVPEREHGLKLRAQGIKQPVLVLIHDDDLEPRGEILPDGDKQPPHIIEPLHGRHDEAEARRWMVRVHDSAGGGRAICSRT